MKFSTRLIATSCYQTHSSNIKVLADQGLRAADRLKRSIRVTTPLIQLLRRDTMRLGRLLHL